jgi:pyrroloquinoline quinone biosynthesis protein E
MYYQINENIIIRKEYFGGVVFDVEAYRNDAYSITEDFTIDLLNLIELGLSTESIFDAMAHIYGSNIKTTVEQVLDEAERKNIILRVFLPPIQNYFNITEFINERKRVKGTQRLSAPIFVGLNMTFKCNQLCSFCYVKSEWKGKHADRLSFEEWKNLVDQLVKYKVPLVDIFGGEPFMWNHTIALVEYINTKPINCIISTNATMVTEEIAIRLKQLNQKKLYVGISMEGYNEEDHDSIVKKKGAFGLLLRTVGYFKKYGINFGINIVVTRQTIGKLEELFHIISELGVPQLTLSYFHKEYEELKESGEISIVEFHNAYKRIYELNERNGNKLILSREGPFLWFLSDKDKRGEEQILSLDSVCSMPQDSFGFAFAECQMGKSKMDFLPDGETVACVLLTDRDEYKIGTFPESTINDLWNSPRMERISKYTPIKAEPCKSCKFLNACKGGCFAYMLNRYGKPGYPDNRCPIVERALM